MSSPEFELPVVAAVLDALRLPQMLLQIIVGPRQVGKSTAAGQIGSRWKGAVVYASAESAASTGNQWIRHHWERARTHAGASHAPILILDEIQKISGWSEAVKGLWDEDRRSNTAIATVILGSSALLIQKGLTESLTGRFLLHRVPHWQFTAMHSAFGLSVDQWIYSGGYPGAASLLAAGGEELWKGYIRDSLVETAIARDVLQMQTVTKPALLRHLFLLATAYPAQILSYNKMLGQLTDAGNTTTLAN